MITSMMRGEVVVARGLTTNSPRTRGPYRRPAVATLATMTGPDRALAAPAIIAIGQGAVLVGYALFDLVEAVRVGVTGPADVSNVPALVLLIAITAAFGCGLLWVGVGWWRGRRWARAPFVFAQIIGGLIGVELARAEGRVERTAGIVMALLAVAGLLLAFSPAATRRLSD